MHFGSLLVFGSAVALRESPSSIAELIGWVYEDPPEFTGVPSPALMAVASNDTSLVQLSKVGIEPYPLRPGYVDFTYLHNLVGTIPAGSTMQVHSFVDGQEWFVGEVDICAYLPFARLECPLGRYEAGARTNTTKLQVPDNGYDNRFSFVARVKTPEGATVVHLAAIVDCLEALKDEL